MIFIFIFLYTQFFFLTTEKTRLNIYHNSLVFSNLSFLFFTIVFLAQHNYITLQVVENVEVYWLFESFFLIDSTNLPFLLLIFFLFPLCYLYSFHRVESNFYNYNRLLCCIQFLLILAFSVNNLLGFYIAFEMLLIPVLYLIGVFGSRGRKIHASWQFFFFTFVSSVLILAAMIAIYLETGTVNFVVFEFMQLSMPSQYFVSICIFFGLLSKIPTLPLHMWLPEAHVEAPTVGSVLLAAIILKLAFYGMVRTIWVLVSFEVMCEVRPIFITVLAISVMYSALAAIRQIDLKKIVAYSSIIHMNMSVIGLFTNDNLGYFGGFYSMYSHGLISAALFFMVGMLYDRFHTRNIVYFGGLVYLMPVLASFALLVILANMGLPGLCGFVGEICLFVSMAELSALLCLVINIAVLLVSIFSLALLFRIFFYQLSPFFREAAPLDLEWFEVVILGSLAFQIVLFGVCPGLFFSLVGI